VAVQSLALALETLQLKKISAAWFLRAYQREAFTAVPLAAAAGLVVFAVVLVLDRSLWPAAVISTSLALGVVAACLLGISIPTLLHVAKLDLTIAAGPLTLAITDVVTLLLYLGLTGALL
jgi:magnesium transporter